MIFISEGNFYMNVSINTSFYKKQRIISLKNSKCITDTVTFSGKNNEKNNNSEDRGFVSDSILNKFRLFVSHRPELLQSFNYMKLNKMFIEKGLLTLRETKKYSAYTEELSESNFENVKEKYEIIYKYLSETSQNDLSKDFEYQKKHIFPLLKDENITADDLRALVAISEKRNPGREINLPVIINDITGYEIFEDLVSSAQCALERKLRSSFSANPNADYAACFYISKDEIDKLDDDSPLMRFALFKDIKTASNEQEFNAKLKKIICNIPCKPIPVEKQLIENVISEKNIDNLSKILNNTDLSKYRYGFPLRYSREKFISDFMSYADKLTPKERIQVYKHFKFKITSSGDMINYPDPFVEESDKLYAPFKTLIDKFMLNNKIIIDPEDKEAENAFNDIIGAFPEFITIIGKIQHRGDSIDYHTFDDLKRIMNHPEYKTLTPQEKRIIFISTLFHDFGKDEKKIDPGHPKKSALIAKEIIKKLPVSLDEKERIFNLIRHGHWLTDMDNSDDIAFYFRRPGDFKLAQIFSEADSNSAGFRYMPAEKRISDTETNISLINKNGILVFADNLPVQEDYYDVNRYGVKYIDFRDGEASVEKYGYRAGTKVKDLKFFCHSTYDSEEDFAMYCDDSKDICLSSMLLGYNDKFDTKYAPNAYIISANNANIVLGGKDLNSTGEKRNYDFAKCGMYKSFAGSDYLFPSDLNEYRSEIPKTVRKLLHITKDEYIELYDKICNLENIEDINDIELSSGKILSKENIIKAVNHLREYLTGPMINVCGYKNEFVIYNPKPEGKIYHGDIETLKLENQKYPIVLV